MPKELEQKLLREGRRRKYTGKRLNAFVYGTMRRKVKWKPKRKQDAKGQK